MLSASDHLRVCGQFSKGNVSRLCDLKQLLSPCKGMKIIRELRDNPVYKKKKEKKNYVLFYNSKVFKFENK